MKWSVLAACLTVAVYTGSILIPTGIFKPNISEVTSQIPTGTSGPGTSATRPAKTGTSEPNATVGVALPMLTITPETGTMGFEACMAHDISELDDGNPWTTNTKLDTMPVYKNTAYNSTGTATSGIGKERMTKLAEQAANALNMKITAFKNGASGDKSKDSHTNNDVISGVTATTTTAEISVTGNGTITVTLMMVLNCPKNISLHIRILLMRNPAVLLITLWKSSLSSFLSIRPKKLCLQIILLTANATEATMPTMLMEI